MSHEIIAQMEKEWNSTSFTELIKELSKRSTVEAFKAEATTL